MNNVDENVGNDIEKLINSPVLNPFTDDQLAWMREMQRQKLNFACANIGGGIYLSEFKPNVDESGIVAGEWFFYLQPPKTFLREFIHSGDEPLCFADYAPLPEGEPKEADHVQED